MIKQLFAMMLAACAAVLLVTACQDPVPEKDSNQEEAVKQIPFSLTVSTETTKVSYSDNDNTYAFKSGDILRVVGVNRTDVYGDLKQNGNTWSGELNYTGEKPIEGTPLTVTLIHADNSEDTDSYAFALVGSVTGGNSLLKEAVENYSLFTANVNLSYTSVPDAVLLQQAAFLDVTMTFDFDGSHTVQPGKALVNLTIGQQTKTVPVDFVPTNTNEDFYVHFMAVVPAGPVENTFTLTVSDRPVTFASTAVLEKNKKYTVARTVEFRPQLGDPLWSDGTYGRLIHSDTQAKIVGIIVYVNHNYSDPDKAAIDDAITEKAAGYGHGLVMALHNAVAGGVRWSGSEGKKQCTSGFVETPAQTIASNNISGYANTELIISNLPTGAASAASIAKGYSLAVAPSNTTGWFLPSIGQWMYTISTDGFGGADPATNWLNGSLENWLLKGKINNLVYVKVCENGTNVLIQALNDRLRTLARDFNLSDTEYDLFGDPSETGNISDNYWTSSEFNSNEAIRMNLGTVDHKNNTYYSSIKVAGVTKTNQHHTFDGASYNLKVRPFLAF